MHLLATVLIALSTTSASFDPVPARHEGDPAVPALPAAVERAESTPAPLPRVVPVEIPEEKISRADMIKMSIVPGSSTLVALLAPIALGTRGGDWGTPATEEFAAWGGGQVGAAAGIGLTALVEKSLPGSKGLGSKSGVSKPALVTALIGVPLLTAAGTGTATWMAGEALQGKSRHPRENLLAACGGALGAEVLVAASALAVRAPMGGNGAVVLYPIAAGATVAYDLSRGPQRGTRRAVMPIVAVRF